MEPVIVADNVGLTFSRNRRRQMSVRELFIHGSSRIPKGMFWVLRNVSFEIAAGECVGVVGANGEGKSTLLRLITGVLLPDEGRVEVRQPVAAIIELGAGFESGLTGRDNVYLKAGLHGRSREWVDERFDQIVEFAGDQVARSLDMPFRHYSSGMKVRLAFSVVTQIDEPILLVDEVLAVGDRKFRRRCYERIEEVLDHGRTLFLVSHNDRDLRRFCTRGLYLRGGELALDAPMEECLDRYAADMGEGEADGDVDMSGDSH